MKNCIALVYNGRLVYVDDIALVWRSNLKPHLAIGVGYGGQKLSFFHIFVAVNFHVQQSASVGAYPFAFFYDNRWSLGFRGGVSFAQHIQMFQNAEYAVNTFLYDVFIAFAAFSALKKQRGDTHFVTGIPIGFFNSI